MHPAAAIVVWLSATLACQWLDYAGLAALGLLALLASRQLAPALGYIRRARWLLLSLWLIIAYHTPGEAYADLAWAPTYEGLVEATRQAARLVVMLCCLAWLFVTQGRDGLLAGLWNLLSPLRRSGLEVERLVVRLALVLEQMQLPAARGAWRRLLHGETPEAAGGADHLSVRSAPWAALDKLAGMAALLMLALVVWR